MKEFTVKNADYIFSVFTMTEKEFAEMASKEFENVKGDGFYTQFYSDGVKTVKNTSRSLYSSARLEYLTFQNPSWILREEGSISSHPNVYFELFMIEGFEGQIRTGTEHADKALSQCYDEMENIISSRRNFARKCGKVARDLKVPFAISLAFKGNTEQIEKFVQSLQKLPFKAICWNEIHELGCGRVRNGLAMEKLGICVGDADTNRINDYVIACIKAGKVLKDF